MARMEIFLVTVMYAFDLDIVLKMIAQSVGLVDPKGTAVRAVILHRVAAPCC